MVKLFLILSAAIIATGNNYDGSGSGSDSGTSSEYSHKPKRSSRIAAQYGSKGGMIRFCLDGEDCNQLMQMKLNRLYEVDVNGSDAGNKAENFNKADYEWLAPEDIHDTYGTKVSTRVKLLAYVRVGKIKDDLYANFSMTTEVFYENATVEYAGSSFDVMEGALKFSINVTDWPWKDPNGELKFGVKLKIKTKKGKDAKNKPDRKKIRGDSKVPVERLDLGDNMYLDSPETCILDYDNYDNVTTTTEAAADSDGISIDWTFPHFDTNMYYDPAMGDASDPQVEDVDDGPNDGDGDGPINDPTPSPAPKEASSSSTARSTAAVLFVAIMAFVFH